MPSHFNPPLTAEEALALWKRLMTRDPVAPSELATAYLDHLVACLPERYPNIHPDEWSTAAEDAILALIKNPASYNPDRQTLDVCLRMSASGDLLNLLERERRHRARRASLDAVEHSPVGGKYLGDKEADPAQIIERREERDARYRHITAVPGRIRVGLTEQEVQVLALMQAGERTTVAFAAVLNIAHLPALQQRRELKRVKDRLKKRMERAGRTDE